jgi:hypothetical protein
MINGPIIARLFYNSGVDAVDLRGFDAAAMPDQLDSIENRRLARLMEAA